MAGISYPPIPVLDLGPIELSLHGLFAGIGVGVGAWWLIRRARTSGLDPEPVIAGLTWGVVGAIVGARVVTLPGRLVTNDLSWGDVVNPTGTYSMLGGVAVGVGVAAVAFHRMRAPAGRILELAAPGLALGMAVGRIGDLAIVEHLGSPTPFFLGYTLKPGYDVAAQHDALEVLCSLGECGPYHSTALYDLAGLLVLFGFLIARRPRYAFATWMIWYGFQRFVIDFARLDAARSGLTDDSILGPLTASQWGGLALAGIGLLVMVRQRSRRPAAIPRSP